MLSAWESLREKTANGRGVDGASREARGHGLHFLASWFTRGSGLVEARCGGGRVDEFKTTSLPLGRGTSQRGQAFFRRRRRDRDD